MKHVFIINPVCNSKKQKILLADIKKHFGDKMFENDECKVYFTKFSGDAKEYVKELASSGENVTVYACGGDGTISEVSCAAAMHDNINVAVVPIGTGNDFVRYFGKKEKFLNLKSQMRGKKMKSDIMTIKTEGPDSSSGQFTGINIANIGFDEKVVSTVTRLRNYPFMKKSIAYTLAVAINLFEYPVESLRMEFDDGSVYEGKVLLAAIANASHYGGGYKAAPKAKIDDGLMDVIIVKPVKRLKFISLIGKYKKGRILDDMRLKKYVIYKRCRSVSIRRLGQTSEIFNICADGEVKSIKSARIEILPSAVNLVIPN